MPTLAILKQQYETLLDFLENAHDTGDKEAFAHFEQRIEDFVGKHPALAMHLHHNAKYPQRD